MYTPTVTATAKSYNQINLTWTAWGAGESPGWGFLIEIQSDSDSRYVSWTQLNATRHGRAYYPYWVVESHYTDITDGSGTGMGSAAQAQIYGLKYSTLYNFRVRCYGQTDAGADTYGTYSATASATTATPSTIRYIVPGGAGSQNGTSLANAWAHLYSASGVTAGTLVLISAGTYASDYFNAGASGTQASRIVIQATPGDTVTITNSSANICILDTSYVIVDGIAFSGSVEDDKIVVSGSRNALVNIELAGNNSQGEGIQFQGATYNLVHGCYLHDIGVISDQSRGEIYTLNASDRNVIQYTHGTRGGHSSCGLVMAGSDYNQIKNNQVDGGWGLGAEVADYGSPGSYTLFEGNVVKDTGINLTQNAPKPGFEIGGPYTTVRRNLIYDGKSASGQFGSTGVELNAANSCSNSLIYNNTIVHNGRFGVNNFNTNANVQIKNNILYNNLNTENYESSQPFQILLYDSFSGFSITHNLILAFSRSTGLESPTTIANARLAVYNTTPNADAAWSEWDSNYTDSPSFINYASRELHLKSTSALLTKGTTVTDTQWGTIDGGDLGAFKYYAISGESSSPPTGTITLAVR